jgi:hypothetical protein
VTTTEPSPEFARYEAESPFPIVIRTDFTDDAAWSRVVEQLFKPLDDGLPLAPHLISDPRYADAAHERILHDVLATLSDPWLPDAVFVADATTMRTPGFPLLALAVEPEDDEESEFRVFADAAVVVSLNLGFGNMDFEDFAGDEPYER